jgi:hypothetical protein
VAKEEETFRLLLAHHSAANESLANFFPNALKLPQLSNYVARLTCMKINSDNCSQIQQRARESTKTQMPWLTMKFRSHEARKMSGRERPLFMSEAKRSRFY